jgi:hypothetical protein
MDEVDSLLSFPASLHRLKMIDADVFFVDESRWEEFIIQTKVPFLDRLEFYISFDVGNDVDPIESDLCCLLISPFCTPFWAEEKL